MDDNSSIEIVESRAFPGAVADEIVASAIDAVHDHGRCVIALAGGGTPGAIYRVLARPPRATDMPWGQVQLLWGDERWVPADDSRSNYRLVQETLLSQVTIDPAQVHPVDTTLATAAESAEAYGQRIAALLGSAAGETPVFDLLLLGIGTDGHTASLFPGDPRLNGSSELCLAVEHPDLGQRVSLSPAVICAARRIVFLVAGGRKAAIIKRVLEEPTNINELPAQLYRQVSERVTFFLDSAAALELSPR